MGTVPASQRWSPRPRAVLAAVTALLAVSLLAPLWITRMESPQYRGDEVLEVRVSAGRVAGDIREIQTLNQYVGVHLPLDTPELRASPWVLSAVLGIALLGIVMPKPKRRTVAVVLLIAMVVLAAGGLALLQYRLWRMGHVRDDPIFEGVPDFTPLVLGSKHIANFTVYMSLGIGGWAYTVALLLTAWIALVKQRAGALRPSEIVDGLRHHTSTTTS